MMPFTILKPAGRVGSISHVATIPPELVELKLGIVTPRVNTLSDIGVRIATGSFIVMLNETLAEPPELFA